MYLPKFKGSHSWYVMCCISAMTILLASWYSRSSDHKGFSEPRISATRLCSLRSRVCSRARVGVWLTLPSPVKWHVCQVRDNLSFCKKKRFAKQWLRNCRASGIAAVVEHSPAFTSSNTIAKCLADLAVLNRNVCGFPMLSTYLLIEYFHNFPRLFGLRFFPS